MKIKVNEVYLLNVLTKNDKNLITNPFDKST